MSLKKVTLVLLLHAYLCDIARSQTMSGGGDCLDFADIAFIVDVSGSIEGDGKAIGKFDQYIKPFLKEFSKHLNVGPGKTQIGMVTFGNYGTLEFPLLDNTDAIIRNIDLFNYSSRGKNTNTSGGIYVARTQLLSPIDPKYRPNAAHIAVVVTDGISTKDHELTIPSAKTAQNLGIIMLAVGVTTQLDLSELVGLASPLAPINVSSLQNGINKGVFTPSGTVAYVPEITDLVVVVNELVAHFKKTVCNATRDCPGGDRAEWCNSITLNCADAATRATCCKTCGPVDVCNNYADIAFLADVSGSIGKDRNDPGYFDRQIKPFFKNFVQKLDIGPDKIRVGMATFGNYGKEQFTLKSDVNEIMRGIDNIVYPSNGENTNTSGGIYVMRTQILGGNSPNFRPDASHLCIIVTDGQSTWDQEKTLPYARDAKNQGILMFAVGATDSINVEELIGIASILPGFDPNVVRDSIINNVSGSSGAVAYSPTIDNLNNIVPQVLRYVGQANCKQAADIVECKDNAYWCNFDYLFPGQCYDPSVERTCCKFCSQQLKSNPNCRYGDEFKWCAAQYCWDKKRNCCETCPMFECRDWADWCRNIYPGSCYNFQTETTCCKSCRQRLTGIAACRYGNQIDWCAPQYCGNAEVNCCASCPAPTVCKNDADWCISQFPGVCYDPQTEKTCCEFCRQHLKSDLMCRYGDQNKWCAAEFCWDKTGNCCQTCPRI